MTERPVPRDRLAAVPGPDVGLSGSAVSSLRERFGDNDIVVSPPSTWRDLVRETAGDPMIWFLLVVSAVFAVLGDYTEAIVLLAALVPLAGMDAYLHRRTQASTQGLARRLAAEACVLRDGARKTIPAREVVPGDLVEVGVGQFIPADGLIESATDMQVDESSLTGETYPVRKQPVAGPLSALRSADMRCWAFAGTRLLTGSARIRILSTGGETLYGEIVRSALAGRHGLTPLQRAVGQLVKILLGAAVALCLLLAAVRMAQGHGLLDAFLSAVTLAIAALPEEFPVVLTFFLGVGVYRLARRQALVRRAVAVENIGRVTCVCSDKTGTLTEGKLILAHMQPGSGLSSERLVELAALAARAESGDPLDLALLEKAGSTVVRRIASFPFTEDRRRETAIVEEAQGERRAVLKGAPETVLSRCALTPEEAQVWLEKVHAFAEGGHKVIAVATQALGQNADLAKEPEHGFLFSGVLAFEDPVRDGVREAVSACRDAGIRILMITGDHPVTAQAIAREIGLGEGNPSVALAETLDLEMGLGGAGSLRGIDAIARAAPSQKLQLVQRLQHEGEIVAVTGDGVNDVPALQAADVGIAMGERGTPSAREVAAIVLLDDNFRTIVGTIAEGRQLFLNLRLAFAYLLMIHIPFVLSAALIPLMNKPLLYLPIHIVWLELIIHPTTMLVFQDFPRSGHLAPAQRGETLRFFSRRAWIMIMTAGLLLTLSVIAGFLLALGAEGRIAHARTVALGMLIFTSVGVMASLSSLKSRMAKAVAALSLLSFLVLAQTPHVSGLLHLEPLHIADLMAAAAAGAVAYVLGLMVRKAMHSGRPNRTVRIFRFPFLKPRMADTVAQDD